MIPNDVSGAGHRAARLAVLGAAVLIAAAAPAAAQEEGAVRVTLDEALERAYEHAPQVVQASGSVRTARAAERSALGAYLPTLSASARSSLSPADRLGSGTDLPDAGVSAGGADDSYSAGLSASWDVFTWGRRGAERTRADAETESAEAALTESRFDVGLAVRRAFYEELRTGDLIEVARSRVERAERGVEAAERRFTLGSATRSDVLRAELERNTARASLLEAETAAADAAFALGRLIGVDGPARAEPEAESEDAPLALSDEEVLASLEETSPAVRSAEAALRAADAGVDAARTQYLPSLRLSTGYDWANENAALTDGRTSWSVGLGVSYPIFDGFQREASVARARVQEQVAEAQAADVRLAVRAEARRALGALRLAEGRIALAGEAVEAAREDLRVQTERYRLGASTILDLLASQESVVQVETDLVSARFDRRIARAELEAITGGAP